LSENKTEWQGDNKNLLSSPFNFANGPKGCNLFRQGGTLAVLTQGTRVKMTKGYRGAEGTIVLVTDSKFQVYVISLDIGLRIAAGPSAFILITR
jgi:hypothetical protein